MHTSFKTALLDAGPNLSLGIFLIQTGKHVCRPYWEYFGRGVANRSPGAYQACDGVQSKITTNFIRACLLEFSLINKL